ncbi:MAG: hypothetical protein JJ979_06740 [Roseibium sp.]|nr:hypothetical protein [Roseibium sp.]
MSRKVSYSHLGIGLLKLTFTLAFAGINAPQAGASDLAERPGVEDELATAIASEQERLWNVMLFGGPLSSGSLEDVLLFKSDYEDAGFVGLALGREVYSNDWFSIEFEGGIGQMFGDSRGAQVWGAGYARWHRFPWNNTLRTTIAVSIGLNYSFRDLRFERQSAAPDDAKKLLHYFSPEVTFALPEYEQTELVFRIHHRSSVYGLFDCRNCGSNTPTIGVRYRF